MDEGVYAPFIRRQNKIHEKIEDAREQTDFHSVKDMEKFAKEHADLAEDLSTAMERSVSNMKKVQSRGKPSQAISKSLSALMDIDTDVIDILSDAERDKLSRQLSKLNEAVTELNSVCKEEAKEAAPVEAKTDAAKTGETSTRMLLGVTDCKYPLIYCSNADKAITGLTFALNFGVFRYLEKQQNEVSVKMWFTDTHGESMSETTDATLSAEHTTKVTFTLHDRASSLKGMQTDYFRC